MANIRGRMMCQNPKCKGSVFEEIHASAWVEPVEDTKSISGKINPISGSGRYYYRCMGCGKLREFQGGEEDLFAA